MNYPGDSLRPSELILNPDGSIYHLNLRPEQIADTIFLVGDPGRVSKVSQHFDSIELEVRKREFVTHTGRIGQRRLTVISTGIGTDNIDIVMNELDALVNIDFSSRSLHKDLVSLNLIRIGTSGSLDPDTPPGALVSSVYALGLDNLLTFYHYPENLQEKRLRKSFRRYVNETGARLHAFATQGHPKLVSLVSKNMQKGITLTAPGFYGPQGRRLRLESKVTPAFFAKAGQFRFDALPLTNFEMETAAIFALGNMLGHPAASCNAILANRMTGHFTENPAKLEARLIEQVLSNIL